MKLLKEFKTATAPKTRKAFRVHNWIIWACNLLLRRDIPAWPDFCGMNRKHLVGTDIIKVGNGIAFRSLACSGCGHGNAILASEESIKKTIKDNRTHCAYLTYYYIPYREAVKPGTVVDTNPAQLKKFEPKIPLTDLGRKIAHITK